MVSLIAAASRSGASPLDPGADVSPERRRGVRTDRGGRR
jgi:hypothetical protein